MDQLLRKLGLENAKESIQISPTIDYAKLALTPEEGFLLSRIDGVGSLEGILQVSTFPRQRTIDMLQRFAEQGVVVKKATAPRPAKSAKPSSEPAAVAPSTDLPAGLRPEFCQEIEADWQRLQNNQLTPAEVLKIPAKATASEAKKAFLKYTKKYHPDRFFRKAVGEYGKKAEDIFQRITKAYEFWTSGGEGGDSVSTGYQMVKKKTAASKPGVPSPIMDRVNRAKDLFRDAKSQAAKDPMAAYNTLRLAVNLDPHNQELQDFFKDVENRVNTRRALKFLQDGKKFEDIFAFEKAGAAYQQAVACDPKNTGYLRTFGEFLLHKTEEHERALELARRVCELGPKEAANFLLLGFCFKALGRTMEAEAAFEKVLELDRLNLFAHHELAELKKK